MAIHPKAETQACPISRGLGDEEQLEKEAEKSMRLAENQEAVDGGRKKEVPGGGRDHGLVGTVRVPCPLQRACQTTI